MARRAFLHSAAVTLPQVVSPGAATCLSQVLYELSAIT